MAQKTGYTLRPGDKIDVRVTKELNNGKGITKTILIFKSQLLDSIDSQTITMAMPTQAGKTILFPVGAEFEAIFYTDGGTLLHADAVVIARKNDGGILMMDVQITSDITKFQRREFYRLTKLIDIIYYRVPIDIGMDASLEEQYEMALLMHPLKGIKGTLINVSGGGVKIIISEELKEKELILVKFSLSSDENEKIYQLMAETIACTPSEKAKGQYDVRLKFVAIDKAVQDDLVKQIVNEERRLLKKRK